MTSSVLDDFVLSLNKSWAPIGTITVRMAFTHLSAGTAKFLDTDDYQCHDYDTWCHVKVRPSDSVIRTAHLELRSPEVMILRYNKMPSKSVMAYNRRNLMKRDKNMCQYCGGRPNPKNLTVDHVWPRAKGGVTHWTNCVMCCERCNNVKADKSLDETGMKLVVRPEMKLLHPHDERKWSEPYVPSWSPIFNVGPNKFKDSWSGFVGKKHAELAML